MCRKRWAGAGLAVILTFALATACSGGSGTPHPSLSPRCLELIDAFEEAKVAWEEAQGADAEDARRDEMNAAQDRLVVSGCIAS